MSNACAIDLSSGLVYSKLMDRLQKGFVPILVVLGILVLVLLAAGAYYIGKSNSSQTTAPSQFAQPPSSSPTNSPQTTESLTKELLGTAAIREELARLGKDFTFSIDKIHKNNIVEGSLFMPGRGGAAFWLYKDQGVWKKLYQGQQSPPCKSLEDLHIEAGINCIDGVNYRITK